MNTFDFSVRLDSLIIGCLKGGNTPQELQLAMIEAIKDLNDAKNPSGLIATAKENG